MSFSFGRLHRTIDGVSQQRPTTLCLVAFVLVSTAVKLNLVVPFDEAAEAWVRQQITPFRTALMFALTQLASTGFVLVATALLAAVLALRKSGYWLGRLALSVPGCMLLNEVLKYLFHRTRPALADPLVRLQTYSFPSGHAVAATVLYGFVVILFSSRITPKVWRVVIGTTLATVILTVGFTRVYLGAHYLTDVLAGVLEGVVWLSFAGMITNRHRPHRQTKVRVRQNPHDICLDPTTNGLDATTERQVYLIKGLPTKGLFMMIGERYAKPNPNPNCGPTTYG